MQERDTHCVSTLSASVCCYKWFSSLLRYVVQLISAVHAGTALLWTADFNLHINNITNEIIMKISS